MLKQFTIASVKRTKREYEYYDVFLTHSVTSRARKGIEYTVELTAENGDRYFLFHERKTDPTLRQYRDMFVDAAKMVSGDGTKFSPEDEGAYKVRRYYTKEEFREAVALQRLAAFV